MKIKVMAAILLFVVACGTRRAERENQKVNASAQEQTNTNVAAGSQTVVTGINQSSSQTTAVSENQAQRTHERFRVDGTLESRTTSSTTSKNARSQAKNEYRQWYVFHTKYLQVTQTQYKTVALTLKSRQSDVKVDNTIWAKTAGIVAVLLGLAWLLIKYKPWR